MRTRNGSIHATIRLKVHPHYGETVAVLGPHGHSAVWIELRDGDVRIVPVEWTDLRPRVDVAGTGGMKPARLAPVGMRALSCWVAARRDVPDSVHEVEPLQSLDVARELACFPGASEDRRTESSDDENAAACAVAGAGAHEDNGGSGPCAAAAAVVGQAGPPDAAVGDCVRRGGRAGRGRGSDGGVR